jgi:hypothetical protein
MFSPLFEADGRSFGPSVQRISVATTGGGTLDSRSVIEAS